MNHVENTVSIGIVQQHLDRCMRICCHRNPFTEQLPSDSWGIVGVFTGRYQAAHDPSHKHCIATAIHSYFILRCVKVLLPFIICIQTHLNLPFFYYT
jgi:hypothetical protein